MPFAFKTPFGCLFSLLLLYFVGNNQDLLAGHKISTATSIAPTPIVPGIPSATSALLPTTAVGGNNNLNINLPENNNAILRLEVELRDKNAPKYRRGFGVGSPRGGRGAAGFRGNANNRPAQAASAVAGVANSGAGITAVNNGNNVNTIMDLKGNAIVPLEKVSKQHHWFFKLFMTVCLYECM